MVSGTLALHYGLSDAAFLVSRASAPKGDEVLKNTGGICMSIRPPERSFGLPLGLVRSP